MESLTINEQPDANLEVEANKAAEAAAESIEQPSAEPQERPEWLPEKFKTQEDLATAYKELEAKLGNPELAKEDSKEEPQDAPSELEGLESFSNEYFENGELSDDSFAALEEAGIPRGYVEQYIAGFEASQSLVTTTILSEVGEENFGEISTWASQNLSDTQLQYFNNQVMSGDVDTARMAVSALQSQYEKDVGSLPSGFSMDGTASKSSNNSFASIAELTTAMSDPRYESDPAYNKAVAERLRNSNIL